MTSIFLVFESNRLWYFKFGSTQLVMRSLYSNQSIEFLQAEIDDGYDYQELLHWVQGKLEYVNSSMLSYLRTYLRLISLVRKNYVPKGCGAAGRIRTFDQRVAAFFRKNLTASASTLLSS